METCYFEAINLAAALGGAITIKQVEHKIFNFEIERNSIMFA